MNSIIESLAPMFAEAREKGLWFYSSYVDQWFSPDELSKEHADSCFVWGPNNWRLLDPLTGLIELTDKIVALQSKHNEFAQRILKNMPAKF